MSSTPIQFHKIWIEQCEAAVDIRERFGLEDALHYLIGEKLFSFVHASEDDRDFAAELPFFVSEIRSMFSPTEITQLLAELERDKFFAPVDPAADEDDLDEEDDGWIGSPASGAAELLRFARIRELLTE